MINEDGRTERQTKRMRGRQTDGHGLRRNMFLVVKKLMFFHEKFAVMFAGVLIQLTSLKQGGM